MLGKPQQVKKVHKSIKSGRSSYAISIHKWRLQQGWLIGSGSLLFIFSLIGIVLAFLSNTAYRVSTSIPTLTYTPTVITDEPLVRVNDSVAVPINFKVNPEAQKSSSQDIRAYVLDEYFRRNNSPLYGTGEIFARKCLEYPVPLDCTTVAAIARAETDLCKYGQADSYFNCWGFGGAGPNRMRFQSWEAGIDRVYRSLAFSYGYEYMVDPRRMSRTFCGSEPGCTGWGQRVLFFMAEIDTLAKDLGVGSLFALRTR